MLRLLSLSLAALFLIIGCSKEEGSSADDASSVNRTDITDTTFIKRVKNCEDYAGFFSSDVKDIQRDVSFDGSVDIEVNSNSCTITTNAIPNHDFNDDSAHFATPVSTQTQVFTITKNPTFASSVTELTLSYDNAIFLNGVKLDLLAAACYGVGNEPLGQEKIGCNDITKPFRYDPMSSLNSFGTDSHNAHTQPDGTYHYHGNPLAMFDSDGSVESPVIGFAADGFPIYGSYIADNGIVRKVTPSYQLKSGSRLAIDGVDPSVTFNENYNGRFVDDWEYVEGLGDLDECNGMTFNGEYGYYVTDAYPWVIKCFKGTVDSSFRK